MCMARLMTANVLDAIKNLGYKYSTRGAITVSVSDIIVPQGKGNLAQGNRRAGGPDQPEIPSRRNERERALPHGG